MVSDKVLAEEWLEELADDLNAAKWWYEQRVKEKSEIYLPDKDPEQAAKRVDKARARLRLMAQLYAALVTANGAE